MVSNSNHKYYWKGVEFVNADSDISSILSNKMEIRVSKSILEHVTIEYAGYDVYGKTSSALQVNGGVPPHINELTIRRSAFTAFNVTDPQNGFQLMNSRFVENRGYGIYINSSVGRVLLSSIEVEENGADGVRFIHFDKPTYSHDSFCQTPNLGKNQVFPIKYTHKQSASKTLSKECCQEFYSKDWEGQRITAHFPLLMSGIDDYESISDTIPQYISHVGHEGSIYIVDGNSGKVIADFFVRNSTKTQSVSSILGNGPLKICYRPAQYRNVLFTVEVVVDYGRQYDLVVADSRIVANNGRGVWLQDLRSGAVLNRTLIASHDYVAGIHLDDGVGELIVNNSVISNNLVDGINITTGGGFVHIDRTEIINNTNRAVAAWFNESIALQSFNYSTHITRCALSANRIGIHISGGCHFQSPLKKNVFWNISMNSFESHREQALLYHTCIPRPRILKMQMKPVITNISISHNKFVSNAFHAIYMAPLFFAKVNIIHNEFTKHSKAVLFVNSRDTFNVDKLVEDAERFPFTFHSNDNKLTNQRSFALDSWTAVVRIRNNHFYRNRGLYVASIGLLEPESSGTTAFNSLSQRVLFTRNVLRDNVVSEPFPNLNPRSKVSAVLCVTSSNVLIWRNEFVNPESKYELGIHLYVHYRVINSSLNYWGTSDSISNFQFDDKNLHSAALIYERIFDRKNRYNLAQVEFLPYILIPNALESDRTALSQVNDRDKILQFFSESSSGEIGGQVRGQVNLPPGTYYVKRDIYISPEGELVLNAGTDLYFDPSVGIFVQGKFKAKGNTKSDIKFLLNSSNRRKTRAVENNSTSEKLIMSTSKPSRIGHSPTIANYPIRLSNGTEGKLEVKIGNEWGTVCGYNFDIEDAAVACHQLGLVLNERDWRLEKSEFWSAGNSRQIVLSNLQCSHLDTDLTSCKAERMADNDFEGGWCPSGEVGIRCFSPGWAGIRFGMLTQEAIIESVIVEKAGLLDYRTRKFVPALQFDFNRFSIKNSIIRNNIDSGLGLMWNDVLIEPTDSILQILDTKVLKNFNHGIVTRTQGIQVKNCMITENRVSGFHYEPSFSREEQEELTSWVVKQSVHNRKVSVYTIPSVTYSTNSHYNQSIMLNEIGKQYYIYIPRRPTTLHSPYRIMISTDIGHRIGVMAISPIFQTRSTETLKLYSPQLENSFIPKMIWDLRQNLTSFPFVYPGYRLVLEYSTGEMPYGGILLLFTPKQYLRSVPGALTILEQGILEQDNMNTMVIADNVFAKNGNAFSSSHCSMNVDFNGNYCKRYANETIMVENNSFTQSKGAGLFVNSHAYSSTIPYSLLMNMLKVNELTSTHFDFTLIPSIIAEINYTLIKNQFSDNSDFGSIVLYDHSLYENGDMQRSSFQSMPGHVMSHAIGANYPSNTNLFHWNILENSLEANQNGGVDIRLPYTWLYNENFTHTVVVRDSSFVRNKNFEFTIGGHYAKVNITKNRFVENQCKNGLISVRGMEKLMRIEDNDIKDNYVQRFVVELNMESHADKFGTVDAFIRRNVIRNNRYSGPGIRDIVDSEVTGYSPETYAISIRGVQQVNVTRNVLVNRNLQFELLAGVRAGSLRNELDARENWWGVGGDPIAIRERIFDFDDWNSFSTTVFSPWLSADHIGSSVIFEQITPTDDPNLAFPQYLGGRLTKSMVLNSRAKPYVVNTDLTVMPGVTLTIRPGVVIEFYPSVGILVLGELAAIGLEQNPIILRSYYRNQTTITHSQEGENILFRLGQDASNRKRTIRSEPISEKLVFSKSDIGGVRLCLTETCDPKSETEADRVMKEKANYPNYSGYPSPENGRRRHGFLEIYNTTTLQWAPVCDARFTQRNAQVVCKQLGFSTLNTFVRRGSRLDMDPTLMTRINHWPEALECVGNEASLSDCDLRTFSKESFDKKTAMYESAPFYNSKMANKNIYWQNSYHNFIFDNQTQELLFYLNDNWKVLEEKTMIQSTSCQYDGDEFVYIFCGEDNNKYLDNGGSAEHWGGVRFALPNFESSTIPYDSKRKLSLSTMQFVHVIGAGILHGEKNAAIQVIQRTVPIEFVTVKNSASHGIEVIAPPESLNFHQLQIHNNLGAGMNLLMLGPSPSETHRVPFQPLGDGPPFSVPYNAFSLVDICDARKELRVGEKILVYYKYDNKPVDCVKIFTSANPLKRIGLRFLQVNLWSKFVESEGKSDERKDDYLQGRKFIYQSEDIFHNKVDYEQNIESYVDASFINSMSDSILIWDGDIFNETTRRLLGEVYSDSSREYFHDNKNTFFYQQRANNAVMRNSRYAIPPSTMRPPQKGFLDSSSKNKLYKSSAFSLSIQLHASGGSGRYGFLAEITTLPSAYDADLSGNEFRHNITYSDITNNTAGAVLYRSVGEKVPPLALLNNVFSRNCLRLLSNFSTCESNTIQLEMQNALRLYFQNNHISDNRAGGLRVHATSYTAASAISAYLINNLFAENSHKEALYFEGADAGLSYQTIHVDRNYFTRNRSPHRSNIVFGKAIVRFHENIVINNYGDSQLFVAGFVHAQSSSKLQKCTRNFFYNNHAVNERGEQSTIIVNTVGQIYNDNYLVNPDNDFELSTRNRTIISTSPYSLKQSILEPTAVAAVLASAIVQAPYNWWGFNETSAVEARIRDSHDYYHLIPVNFKPIYTGNWSVLSGSCFGGYEKIADTCFVYAGGRMKYHAARQFCEKDNSSMPFVRAANQAELTRYVYLQRPDYNRRRHPVWVQSFDVPIGSCSVLIDGYVQVHDCNDELPFLCERDPEIGISTATLEFWYQEHLGIAAIAISFITAFLSLACICCWICKSRHRHLEKLERRNSIRASIRSSRSFASSMNTLNSDANYFTNRKLLQSQANNVPVTNENSMYRSAPQVNSNPTSSIRPKTYNDSISSTMSIFNDQNPQDERMTLAQKRFTSTSKPNMYEMNQREPTTLRSNQSYNSNLNLIMRPSFDLMFENQAFKGQSTPISPASFLSREDPNQMRAWTPETNSTLDFKVRPQTEPRDLSQYTASTDNLHKSIPSTTSSAASSPTANSPSPSSILSQSSQQPQATRYQPKQNIRAPVNPPPPPPVRRMIEKNARNQQNRQSMDPNLLYKESDDDANSFLLDQPNRELSTFGQKKPTPKRHLRQPYGEHDGDPIGGSQPSLLYESYKPDSHSIGTQESNMHYLETSLDGDSFYNQNFENDSAKRTFGTNSSTAATPKLQMYASQPLETAM